MVPFMPGIVSGSLADLVLKFSHSTLFIKTAGGDVFKLPHEFTKSSKQNKRHNFIKCFQVSTIQEDF